MKAFLFRILRKIVFKTTSFYELYWRRFLKDFYTDEVYRRSYNIGKGVKVNGRLRVSNYRGLTVGNNVHIGENSFFFTDGGLIIGDNTHFSRNVTIYTASHHYEGEVLPYDARYNVKAVVIERNVWIGMNVSIAPGVRIGEGAIVGIGCVVTTDVAAGAIVVNNSTTVVKQRDAEHYTRLDKANLFGGASGHPLQETDLKKFLVPVTESAEQVFIVSTGRSGSQTIASILNQHPTVKGWHEPHWQLIKLSTEYEQGIINREQMMRELKDIYAVPGIVPAGFCYAESDQKISNLISLYAELFPKAKFVWIIREPGKFIKSCYTRGWYREENAYNAKGRLLLDPRYPSRACRVEGPRVGAFTEVQWKAMDAFDKCCWYWSYWNERIEQELGKLDASRWVRVDVDRLDEDMKRVSGLVNRTDFAFRVEKKNQAHKSYRKAYDAFKGFSDVQRQALEKHCGKNYERWFN